MWLKNFSYRFAEQVLNSKLTIKREIEDILTNPNINIPSLSLPEYNRILKDSFTNKGWENQPRVFDELGDPSAKMDFLKERVGIEAGFGHPSFIGIDLLKFQVASYSGLDRIDLGVYIVSTSNYQKQMKQKYSQNWEGSLSFEKVIKYLPHFKSAIQVPIYVIGIEL